MEMLLGKISGTGQLSLMLTVQSGAELELADGWERKKDGYLYHTGILEEDGILELYDAVIADSDVITKEDQILVLETTIQAVQSEHLEVSSDGWGDIEIRQTLRSRNEVRSNA